MVWVGKDFKNHPPSLPTGREEKKTLKSKGILESQNVLFLICILTKALRPPEGQVLELVFSGSPSNPWLTHSPPQVTL